MTLSTPVFTGTLNGSPLRFFKAPLQGAQIPWHAADDLYRCLKLPRDLRRHFQQRLKSSEWKDDVQTVATADGIATIAPHFIAQGVIGAMQDVGRADTTIEMHYAKQVKEAWDFLYPGGNFAEAMNLLCAAIRNQDGGAR